MKPDHRTAKAFCETLVGYVLPDVRNLADCYIEVERELARINPLYTAACIQARDAEAALETAAEDAFASWDAARKAEERLATIEAKTIERCAKVCNQMHINYKRWVGDSGDRWLVDKPYDPDHCACAIRALQRAATQEQLAKNGEDEPGKTEVTPVVAAPAIGLMVDRFLSWPLPRTFCPDGGISFDGCKPDKWNPQRTWPIGTNLFTEDEARKMFEHALDEDTAPQALRSPTEKAETPSTTPVVAALGLATQSYPGGPVYQVGASTGTYDEDTIKARDWDKWCHWCRTATHSDVECVASRKSTYADGLKQWEEKQEENK